ncbi:diacylglycerol/lipid kinase family protein [Helicovermis profundi]|uniref:Diacylglycerol kinase family lipid kinase n=1 Tax=Helicovermis profundi TaxID=3065157 RepID=A0AAU9E6T4_9FIRM|nr:diacylglycerol kinase family lipid kinase [Clostridia bacterium S502]
MRKILFVVNPVAGSGKSKTYINIINKRMKKTNIEFDIKISSSIGNVTELCKAAKSNGYTSVVSVGGDGTLFEAINGIFGENIKLGIIGSGTGNDFIRSLKIPLEIEKALDVVINKSTKFVDIGIVNDKYFLNVVSFGIDGEIVRLTDKIKNYIKGTSAYITATLKSLATYKPKAMSIKIDGKLLHREAYLVAVGNGKYFGGGMMVLPEAEIDDGLFDICIVNKMNKLKLIALFPSIFTGKHMSVSGVENYRAKEIEIRSIKEKLVVNADGNLIGPSPALIKIAQSKLEIFV